jgi:thiol-disulfide isomerase/thioredoxin
MRTFTILAGVVLVAASPIFAATAAEPISHTLTATNASAAWSELEAAMQLPEPPADWKTNQPTQEMKQSFYRPLVLALSDKAKDFYTRFPTDPHALEARKVEFQILDNLVKGGETNQLARFDAAKDALLKDPALTEADRFHIRRNEVVEAANAKESEHEGAGLEEFKRGVRALQKEFPNQPEVQKMLLTVAMNSEPAEATPILREITNSAAPEELKDAAAEQLKKLDGIGKPIGIQFTAVDGRQVDVQKLKGKVVLVDFWATWCGPCVRALPDVKAAYDKYHSQGLEIVGISLDKEKDALTKFVAENDMQWPQYFDGLYWQNKLARQFGIESIPTMWLLDKHGLLRDIDAHSNLGGKIGKLLAE